MKTKDFKFVGEGRNRIVFRHGNYVVKVPKNINGISDNYHERQVWLKNGSEPDHNGIQYARCRLIGQLLVMQFAAVVGPRTMLDGRIAPGFNPWWANYVDCRQVGYNRFGKIVAYDYGR